MKPLDRFAFLLLAAAPLSFSAGARAAKLAVVVDELKPGTRKLISVLERDFGSGNDIRVHTLRSVDFSNPVAKGRFLAGLSASDLVIPIGDPASRLIAHELEDLRTFFIAAGGLSGEYLSRRHVGGILSYSPEETVRVAKALVPSMKDIGVLYTPGYEGVTSRMQSEAVALDIAMTSYRVKSRREVGPVAREALARADLLWVVGDALLTQDLVFAYILQESLRLKKPLASPLPELVRKGGLFCTIPNDDRLAEAVSAVLADFVATDAAGRAQPAPDGGFVLVNRQLMEKWGLRVPASMRLWEERVP